MSKWVTTKSGKRIKVQKKSDWISVKDKMPKSRQIVLMYIKSKEKNTEDAYAIGFLNSVGFKWHTANLYADIDDCREEVTHWMPLPEPPKGKHGNMEGYDG